MSTRDPIERVTQMPSGAVFYRCALQVNPHHYGEKYRGKPTGLDEKTYLFLYPCDTSEGILGRHLGQFGIRETEPSADLSDKRFREAG